MSIFSNLRITASGLTAQRLRMDVIANNIANAETTRTDEGGAYQRQQVVFMADQSDSGIVPTSSFPGENVKPGQGVRVQSILTDNSPGQRVYDPRHPDADEDGFVNYPNVNIVTEMTDMLSATRSYEANVTVFNALKNMALKALDIGQK
ncbi:MAG: flagellar basal body rod protein FlgC [Chloroflexota bacterium]